MAKEAKAVETTEVAPQQTVKTKPEWEIKERVYFLKEVKKQECALIFSFRKTLQTFNGFFVSLKIFF